LGAEAGSIDIGYIIPTLGQDWEMRTSSSNYLV
jgi:hypothetical protein